MDYFISLDDEVPIAAHSHYSEQLVRMQHINTVPLAEPFTSRLKRLQLNISAVAPASSSAHEDQHSDENVFKAHQEAENDRKALSALNFSVDDDIILVLGRLFKVHPEFDDIIADLLLQIVELTAAPATSTTSEDVDADSATSTYIVFIAESLDALNVLVYERMLAALQLKLRSTAPTFSPSETTQEDSRAHKLFHRYVRFIGYDHYYTLLRSARVVLDTYPYGGETHSC